MGIQINGQTDTISASDGGLSVSGMDLSSVTSINASGIITATSANVGSGITLSGTQINVGSATTIHSGGFRIGSSDLHSAGLSIASLNSSGVSTFSSGPVLIGTGSSTGTASQPLQVTGGAYVSGSIGIGTTNPGASLDVQNSAATRQDGGLARFLAPNLNANTDNSIALGKQFNTSVTAWQSGLLGYYYDGVNTSSSNSYIYLNIAGRSNTLVIHSNDCVGIGTAVPGEKLDVSGNIAVGNVSGGVEGGQITIRDKSGTASNALNIDIDGSNNSRIFNIGNGNLVLGNLTGGSGSVKLYTNASERFSINSSGDVGIGTTNPLYKLDVFTTGASNAIRTRTDLANGYSYYILQNSGASGREYHFGLGGSTVGGVLAGSAYLYDATAGANRIIIDSSGRITMPSQVYVYASSVTRSGTANPVSPPHYPFTTYSESYDVGSNFNATTGVFTAPVTGKYLIMGTWSQDATTGRTIGTLSFNGNYEEWVEGNNAYDDETGSKIRVLAANDTVSFGSQNASLGSIVISIWLLG